MINLKTLTEKYLKYCAVQKKLNFKTIKVYFYSSIEISANQ